jgi:hypothetical protein
VGGQKLAKIVVTGAKTHKGIVDDFVGLPLRDFVKVFRKVYTFSLAALSRLVGLKVSLMTEVGAETGTIDGTGKDARSDARNDAGSDAGSDIKNGDAVGLRLERM